MLITNMNRYMCFCQFGYILFVVNIADVHLPESESSEHECHQWGDQPYHLQPACVTGSHPAYHAPLHTNPTMDNPFHPIGRERRLQYDGQHGQPTWNQLR